jgi:dTDP-4-amino-4,6-dideoxy-D-galactose acyltransferase
MAAIKEAHMTGVTFAKKPTALARLDWESNHFGISAAQLTLADLADDALAAALQHARDERVQLLVWPAASKREIPRELLDEFGGQLVDRKATFVRALASAPAEFDSPRPTDPAVIDYPAQTASSALVELAIASGQYSRFHVDRGFRPERFEAMYRVWIERSVAGELADVVLVAPLGARGRADGEPLAGMITLSESQGVATIGLVAVAAAARQQGIGSALLRAAHRWMRSRQAHTARVVTQLANLPACRLYERSAYQLASVQHYFHFWL